MKAFSFAVALVVVAVCGRAVAADLPAVAAPPPPPPPAFSWTGVYLGANGGYMWGARNGLSSFGRAIVDNDPPFGATSALGVGGVSTPNFTGAFGGGQVGYNYQISRFVVGFEADAQGTAVQGSEGRYTLLNVPTLSRYSISTETQVSRNIDYLATVRGRVGFAVRPEALLYLTGGLAFGQVSHTVTHTQYANWAGSPRIPAEVDALGYASSQYSNTRVGWAAGGGVEWAFRGNWSAKVEYLYYDLGRIRSTSFLAFDTNSISGPGGGGAGLVSIESSSRFNGHILRAGLNYRLEFFRPPVVAAY